jgi:hypothetical protein
MRRKKVIEDWNRKPITREIRTSYGKGDAPST